jgi:hypothetical protein
VEVQNISKILHNQSLASGQKLPLTAQTEFSSLNTTPTIAMPVEDEEKAWMSLGESSQSNQTAGTSADAERKKRKYTKKNQKNQIVDGSGPNKNKQ